MTIRFMLDTPIVSDLIRHPQGRIATRIAEVGEGAIGTSIIVAGELRFGAAKRGSARLTSQVEAVLAAMEIMPLEAGSDVTYATIRLALEAAGTPIGANDMLIAAHALALGCSLVTDNEREFRRVADLAVENWLR